MYPHRIRLRGPWECEPLESAGGTLPPPSRVTMPCHWHETGLSDVAGPLELYLLLDRSTVAYKTVTASGAAPFEVVSDAVLLGRWRSLAAAPVKLDLIQGATVWYSVEALLTTDDGQRTTDQPWKSS